MTRTVSAATPAFLAIACVGFVASAPAQAADEAALALADVDAAAADAEADGGGRIVVTGSAYEPKQESPKSTRPVLDTPQTVTVITAQTIEQQNALTLRDVLTTVPGITFGAGEGGGGYGDSIVLRGFTANTDITQDGVRDSAQYSRTDSFNLEQLEVVNGANSVYGGSGSVGGSINIVTKRPQAMDATTITGGIGTENYYRGTVDANQRFGGDLAVRLNAMFHHNDVPGRDVEEFERWGVAPSITFGIDSPTRFTALYFHQEDTNVPSYGVPYYISATNDGPLPGVDNSKYWGYRNVDTQRINVDQATLIFEHDFSDTVSLRNLSRWQDVRQLSIVDPPQGTFCLANGLTAAGAACTVDLDTRTGAGQVFNITVPAGYYLPSGPRGNARDSANKLLYNQIDLRALVNTGGIEHTIVLGAAVSHEEFDLSTGNMLREANGTSPYMFDPATPNANAHLPYIAIANPDAIVAGPVVPGGIYGSNTYTGTIHYIETARQAGELDNYAVYLFDTLKVSEEFEINAGARYEHNTGWYRADTVQGTGPTIGTVTLGTRFDNSDNLFSYRVGLVYKPLPSVSIEHCTIK